MLLDQAVQRCATVFSGGSGGSPHPEASGFSTALGEAGRDWLELSFPVLVAYEHHLGAVKTPDAQAIPQTNEVSLPGDGIQVLIQVR